jgi:hypothetical protein
LLGRFFVALTGNRSPVLALAGGRGRLPQMPAMKLIRYHYLTGANLLKAFQTKDILAQEQPDWPASENLIQVF